MTSSTRSIGRRIALTGAAMFATFGIVAAASLSASAAPSYNYVPVGDSYAAGVGAGGYTDYKCMNSKYGYPSLLDADAGITLTARPTCSGATTANVVGTQLASVAPTTTLVTVTVGGNDLGFSNIMLYCFIVKISSTCNKNLTAAEAKLANGSLAASLKGVYTAVAAKAPSARIVVTGYPILITNPVAGSSGARVNADTVALNDTIEANVAALAATGVAIRYVDVEAAFAGHGVGSAAPWIIGPSGLTTAFHPTATGYKAYAAAIRPALV